MADPELFQAAERNDVAGVRRCLARGDEVDGRDEFNLTPLMAAAWHTDPTVLLLLLHHGSDMQARNKYDATALHWAAYYDRGDCVRVLTALGAPLNAVDAARQTPVMWAAYRNSAAAARALVEAGADLSLRVYYKTALDAAKNRGSKAAKAVLTDPATLSFGNRLMSDEDLQTRLQSLPSDMRYRVLLLQGNLLSRVPDLTKLPQFSQLQVLNMADNRLTEVREEHLPASVKTLYLSHNPIHTMSPQLVSDWLHSYFHMMSNSRQSDRRNIIVNTCPIVADVQQKVEGGVLDIYGRFHDTQRVDRLPDLSHMETVREVFIPFQDITHIDGTHFPEAVENINLNHNMIEDVTHIKELKCLKKISLSGNKLKSTPEFPDNMEHIDLDNNNLEDPPDIKQLKCLKKISLSGNKLKSTPEFPDNMEHIVLDNNNLEDPPDIKQLKCLKKISLSGNKLKSTPEFPENTEHIDLSNNALQSVTNLSYVKKIKSLNFANNEVVVLFGFHTSLQSLELNGNTIHTLHRDCFPSEEVYKLVSEALTREQIEALQQPPAQIFRRGYEAVIQYYDQADISQLTDKYSNRMTVVGEALAGKTSLVHTLIHGVPCLTGEEERTEVVQTHTWRLPDGCTYQVFDQGGQEIYGITNRFFLSKDSKNLICHNIKDGSIKVATEMLENILHQFPNGHIHFGLTKLDLIKDEDVLKEKVDDFKVKISNTFEREIALLKSQTKAKLDVNLITSYESRKKTVQFFPVSSQNVQGTSEVASFFHDIAKANKQKIPKHWLKCLKSIQKDKKPFLKHAEYKEYYDKHDPSAKNLLTAKLRSIKRLVTGAEGPSADTEDTSSTSLRYFSDCGLVIWYEDHPTLKDFVFHNIQYLISLMKCVFRHDLVDHLSYDTNTDLQKVFNKTDYEKAIEEFQTQGQLSLKLLTYLWKDEFAKEIENKDEVLELMKCLDICHEVLNKKHPDENDEKKYFFSWFVTERKEPCIIRNMLDTDNSHIMLHLECIFSVDIPINVTELLIVQLQRLASEKRYFGDRKAWRDGLFISDGDMKAPVIRRAETHSLQIYVKDETGEICAVWKDFLKLKDSLLETLSHWHGIVERIHIPCFHCVYVKKSDPYKWPLEDVFGKGREKVYTSCSEDTKVPAALVTIINTGDSEQTKQHIQAVTDFLHSTAQGKKSPGSAEKTSSDSAHSRQRRIQKIPDISDRSLCIVARQIGHDWKDVCESLGFTQGELETLEYDNRFNLTARITNMLIEWRQRQDLSEDQMLNTLHSTFQECRFEVQSPIEKDKVQETAPNLTAKVIPSLIDMSDSSLNTVASQIGHQWMEVGYSLGFTKAELENIEHDYTRLIDINTTMLIQWRQRQEGDPSDDQMLKKLYSTFQECKLEVKSNRAIEVGPAASQYTYTGTKPRTPTISTPAQIASTPAQTVTTPAQLHEKTSFK